MEGTATFEPQQQHQQQLLPGAKQPSRLILLVEATAAAAANNKTARKWIDLLLKKIEADARSADSVVSGSGAVAAGGQAGPEDLPRTQYALIVYGTWDRSTQAPLQFSSWCSSLTELFEWLNGVQFVGGSPNKGVALTEALAQAIIMSKCPYPDGSRPTAAGPTHPQPTSAQESHVGAHTHVWVVCSSFSPCRLPIPWACEADTKAALAAGFYPTFLERFETVIQQLRVSSSQPGSNSGSSIFSNFDSIKQSLQPPITPGTADIWDLTLSLSRHRMSLSILSGMHKHSARTPSGEQYRSCVELFCYANACLSVSALKAACKVGMMGWQVAQAALLMSPLHAEASKAGMHYVSKLMTARQQKQQRDAQQQQQQQAAAAQQQASQAQHQVQQQQPSAAMPPQQGGFPAAGANQAPVQAQQQQQPGQLSAQQQQHLAMMQRQQTQQAQAQQQQQQQQLQQAQMQMRQQQQQAQAQQQQQQQPQQQQWMQAAQAAAVRPTSAQQAMQQQQAAQAAANRQQQMALAGQPVQAGMVPQHQAMLLQQQQQQQAHQQQQLQAGRYGVPMASMGPGQVPGVVMMGQQQPQQQLPGMSAQMVSQGQVFVQSQPQQMMLQQQPLGGYMHQQALPGMPQQMMGVQVNVQQPQQPQMQMQAQGAAAAGGAAGRQRSAFWRGTLYIDQGQQGHPGQQGLQYMPLAEVELLSSNAAAMATHFSNRGNQIVSNRLLNLAEFKQLTSNRGPSVKVSRGSFKVVAPLNYWSWLQGQVQVKADKQIILEGVIQGITTIFFFGNQETKGQAPSGPLNMIEGSVIYCVPV